MLAAADLWKQIGVAGQRHAHQLTGILTIELQLEYAAGGDFRFAFRVLASEPQEFGDAIA